MPYEYILTEQRDRVGLITFNKPDRLNVFSYPMFGEVRRAIETFNDNPAVGAVVLTGSGRAFCAGADIQGWDKDIDARERGEQRRQQREEENWVHFIQRSKPVICAINGLSIGVGLTMTLPCDVRIAAERARLSMRFVRVGRPAGAGQHSHPGAHRWPHPRAGAYALGSHHRGRRSGPDRARQPRRAGG